MKKETKMLIVSGTLFGLTLWLFTSQGFVTRAWDVVSNFAKWFIAVPADGSAGFNSKNLVALWDDGKLPEQVLPASAMDESSSNSKFVNIVRIYEPDWYRPASCPAWYEMMGVASGAWNRDYRVYYDTLIRNTWPNNGVVINSMNIWHNGCRLWVNERKYDNLANKIYCSSKVNKRRTVVTECIKVY